MTIEITEKAPPGWAGTVKAMKKHMSTERAFALAWSMHKKGMEPHYKALASTKSDKEPELKKKYQKSESVSDQLQGALESVDEGREDVDQDQIIETDGLTERVMSKTNLKQEKGLTKVLQKNKGTVVYANSGKETDAVVVEYYPRTKTPYFVVLELPGYGKVNYINEYINKNKAIERAKEIAKVGDKRKGMRSRTRWDVFVGDVEEDAAYSVDRNELFEECLLTEKGKHYYDGKNYYVDTAFLNSIGTSMKDMKLSNIGFGEFSLKSDGKSIEFDRGQGKKFKGQSGQSHMVYDNKKGALVKKLIGQMEKKGRSELVREEVGLDEGTARETQIVVDKAATALEKKFKGTSIVGMAVRNGAEAWLTIREKKVSPARFEKEAQKLTGWKWNIGKADFPGTMVFKAQAVKVEEVALDEYQYDVVGEWAEEFGERLKKQLAKAGKVQKFDLRAMGNVKNDIELKFNGKTFHLELHSVSLYKNRTFPRRMSNVVIDGHGLRSASSKKAAAYIIDKAPKTESVDAEQTEAQCDRKPKKKKKSVSEQLDAALHERARMPSEAPLGADELRSDNPMLKRELQRAVDQTRKFVRSVYQLEDVAAELAHAAKETERIRRTAGVERAMRRSPLGNAVRSFEAETKKLYGAFAEGRNSIMSVAKMARIPTRRTGKRKGPSVPTKKITATNLVREVLQVATKMNVSIREVGELGSVSIREMEKLLNQKSVISGDKLMERLWAIVQAYLDFRDQVSQSLFKMISSVVRRMNEITKRLMGMNEDVQDVPIMTLEWLSDPDFEELDEQIVVISVFC